MIRVVLFASLREQLGTGATEVTDDVRCISDLVEALTRQHGKVWRVTLHSENVRVAVNKSLVQGDHHIMDGDEVAFFPPVTGG